jgi:hypothetical protein
MTMKSSAVRKEIMDAVKDMWQQNACGDRVLYHGTSLKALRRIFQSRAIKPRGTVRPSNWKHTIESNPSAVYLTSAYPLSFAQQAAEDHESVAIIEVNMEALTPRLQADEDAIEQALRGKDKLPEHWDVVRRTRYYRSRAHLYRAEASLAVLGTCAHRGEIGIEHCGRVAVIDAEKQMEIVVMGGLDPAGIGVLHYAYCGAEGRALWRWLFNESSAEWCSEQTRESFGIFREACERMRAAGQDVDVPQKMPTVSREGIRIYQSINDAFTQGSP